MDDDDFKTISSSSKSKKRRRVSKPKFLSNSSASFGARCPMCQFPFVEVKERDKNTHTGNCKGARDGAKECPDGLNCQEKENKHFHIFSHFELALSRSHEESKSIKKEKNQLKLFTDTSADHEAIHKRQKSSDTVSFSHPEIVLSKSPNKSKLIRKENDLKISTDVSDDLEKLPERQTASETVFSSHSEIILSRTEESELTKKKYDHKIFPDASSGCEKLLKRQDRPENTFPHEFVLPLENSKLIENENFLPNVLADTSGDLSKSQKTSGTEITANSNGSPNKNCSGNLTGQIIFHDEIVTAKQMTVKSGILNVLCEICNKSEDNLLNAFKPLININCLSSAVDSELISTVKKHPVGLIMMYNEQGWKKISVSYFSGFQVKELYLQLGNCCHFVELKCVIGKESGIQGSENLNPKTLASFDFDGLGLNGSTSSQNDVCEKLWLNCDIHSSEKTYSTQHSSSVTVNVSSDYVAPCDSLSETLLLDDFDDAFNESFTLPEDTLLDQKETVEKWKTLFKRKNSIDDLAATTTALPSFSEKPKFGAKPCPFYKKIPGTSFAVDAFRYGVVPGVSHYFLTHFHSDHYGGLTKKFQQRIICSSVTAALVAKKLYVERKYLYVVKHMETFPIGNVKITPLDANHCPGSLMFLFQVNDGNNYLHVGDFRACSQMEEYPILSGITVNVLYLDTTYCNPMYQFPTQEDVVEAAIRISLKQIRLEPATLIVSGTYTIGKEKVFMGIANALKSNIWAPKGKREVLLCLNDKELISKLVDHPCKAQVHVWPMTNLNHESLEQHLKDCQGAFKQILAFNPSGWNYKGQCAIEDIPGVRRGRVTIVGVPYSEHSSYNELRRFVKFLKPMKVVPTVASRNQSFSAVSQCCNKWLREPEEKIVPDRQQKLTSFFTKNH